MNRNSRSAALETTRAALCAVLACTAFVAAAAGELKKGEYACYGSGGRIMAGMGFKVSPGGRYTDLDNKEKGSYTINGDKVVFKGGHMDKMEGRKLQKNSFALGRANCEPY